MLKKCNLNIIEFHLLTDLLVHHYYNEYIKSLNLYDPINIHLATDSILNKQRNYKELVSKLRNLTDKKQLKKHNKQKEFEL